MDEVADLAVYPELRWLDRNAWVPILATALGLLAFGIAIGRLMPWTGTNGPQLVIWAFFINPGAVMACHVCRELSLSPLGKTASQHQRRQPKQFTHRCSWVRGRLAQQPPSIPGHF
ncbi:MAG: hypothetical protein Ct9H300mP26_1940 [Acidimicrobiales bacterium]|nr:MAG: hypothetical protein Ct9H300mP26_1940 [Acidimicrobiales bacterium]